MKTLTKLLVAAPLVLATGTLSCISTVHAHEFIIKPAHFRAEPGTKVPFGKPAVEIKREKFCKTLLISGSSDKNYAKILGHKLEIVPLSVRVENRQELQRKDSSQQVLKAALVFPVQ